jgi:hypothetical protein
MMQSYLDAASTHAAQDATNANSCMSSAALCNATDACVGMSSAALGWCRNNTYCVSGAHCGTISNGRTVPAGSLQNRPYPTSSPSRSSPRAAYRSVHLNRPRLPAPASLPATVSDQCHVAMRLTAIRHELKRQVLSDRAARLASNYSLVADF